MSHLLEVQGVSKAFDGKAVIEDISLHLDEGEVVSLLGASGGGKTTLFDIIAGISQPGGGQVFLKGEDITGKSGAVSYMLQKDLLLPYRTVEDNVALPLLLRGMDKASARSAARSHFDAFGLAGTERLWPHQLSGGMRQRAAFLRTFLCEKEVALLDEPFSALDTMTRSALHQWYLEVMQRIRLSTLLVTHDIDEAILLSHRIYLLTGTPGRITAELTIDAPWPRGREFLLSEAFLACKRQVLSALEG